jgi:hypothetical protein
MYKKAFHYVPKIWLWRLIAILTTAVLVAASGGVNMWLGKEAQALTINPDRAGIAQGALVDRPAAMQDEVINATKESGAEWIRLDLWWFQVEETKGKYVWDKFDNLYKKAVYRDPNNPADKPLKILLVVSGAPTWATGCASVWCPPKNNHQKSYKNFLTAAANRYKQSPYNVTTYEIWNEPNIISFFETPDAKVYADSLLKPAYTAITTAQPGATILTGGTSPAASEPTEPEELKNIAPWEFVRDLYKAGAKNYFHHIAHHPYTWDAAPTDGDASWNSFLQMYVDPPATKSDAQPRSIRGYMVDAQDSAKNIWATEVGYPIRSCTGCTDESKQKDMLIRVYNEWSKKDFLDKIFWYAMRDDVKDGQLVDTFGLRSTDNSARPAFEAFSKIVSERYAGVVKSTAGAQHYWRLDELKDSTAYDAVTAAGNGTYIGTVARGADNLVVGTPAATFPEEKNNRVEVANSDSHIRLAGSEWTIEFNARRVGGTMTWPGLMGRGNARTADGWLIYNHHGNNDRLSFGRNGQECMTTSVAFADGKARHYAVTYSAGYVRWYVDGVASGNCPMTFPTPSTDDNMLWLGASPDSPGNNALGHVAIYNTALTEDQVQSHANARVTLP